MSHFRILLVSAPYMHLYGKNTAGISYYFPLGLGYIAAFLEKHGFRVDLVVEDGHQDVFQDVQKLLSTRSYGLVGISSMTSAYPAAVDLARIVRQAEPRIPIVIGGAHASVLPEYILKTQLEFDFVCTGEGEDVMLDLAGAVEKGAVNDFSRIEGLAWRNHDGQIVMNRPRELRTSLDELPLPARHLVEFERFSLHSHVGTALMRSATMITSRGCPFRCIFCAAHLVHGRKYRFHSDDYVISEIRSLIGEQRIKYVFFEDDTFTAVPSRMKRLCERFVKERLDFAFGCFSRVDVFDRQMAETLQRAGCRLVVFGVESGVPEILKKMHKGTDLSKAESAIRFCREYGIDAYASFVVGFPFETKEDIRKTIDFGLALNPNVITFNPFVPYPGTPLFDQSRHMPQQVEGWTRFLTTQEPPFDMVAGLSAKELRALVSRAHLRFYLQPKNVWHIIRKVDSAGSLMGLIRQFAAMILSASIKNKS